MAPRYLNARDILPWEVLLSVSEALGNEGGLLYVPPLRRRNVEARNRRILELHARGFGTDDIADLIFVHVSTVRRVIRLARAASAPSDQAPGQDPQPLDQ